MAIMNCKSCGAPIDIAEGVTVYECEYCGRKQTMPRLHDERKMLLFARANQLRRECRFDQATGVYESILADFPEEAEAYWGLLLCRYGVEYVDDPKTGKKIPTCHRSSFTGVMEDSNYQLALQYADEVARKVYEEDAKEIEALRRGIIAVSSKEEPYDIFICYKETDDKGERTIDSVLAQDVYTALTEKGYRVFFSRISLEDKLGVEYEPYIFAALHSAKVMLAFGTSSEHYNAVWVKNEWSRFLHLIANGEKKTLIPCYKDINAYDLPKEFKALQAQDLGKVGSVQDLVRGIGKIIEPPVAHLAKTSNETEINPHTYVQNSYTAKKELTEKEIFSLVRIVNTMSNLSEQAKSSNNELVRGYIKDLFSEVSNILKQYNPNDYKYQWIVFCVYKGFLPYLENYIDEKQIPVFYRNAMNLSPNYLKDIFEREKNKEIPSFECLTFNQEKLKKEKAAAQQAQEQAKREAARVAQAKRDEEKAQEAAVNAQKAKKAARRETMTSILSLLFVIAVAVGMFFVIFKTNFIRWLLEWVVGLFFKLFDILLSGVFG